jgi:hypothetical protein
MCTALHTERKLARRGVQTWRTLPQLAHLGKIFFLLSEEALHHVTKSPLVTVAIDKLSMLSWALMEAVTANEIIG